MSDQTIADQLAAINATLLSLREEIAEVRQNQGAAAIALVDVLATLKAENAEVESIAEGQSDIRSSLEHLAAVLGMVFISTNARVGIPASVWNDPVFDRFLELYPVEGPPIVGAKVMKQMIERLDEIDPAEFAATLKASNADPEITGFERVRNAQLVHHARAKFGDLERYERGKGIDEAPER
jgi:hypothetical protein